MLEQLILFYNQNIEKSILNLLTLNKIMNIDNLLDLNEISIL